jgi:hypothetical protein
MRRDRLPRLKTGLLSDEWPWSVVRMRKISDEWPQEMLSGEQALERQQVRGVEGSAVSY